jgi:hypothetical protein
MIYSLRSTVGNSTYFENIYDDASLIAYIFSYEDGGVKYVIHNNIEQHYIKGFDTVADAKESFFKLYDASK